MMREERMIHGDLNAIHFDDPLDALDDIDGVPNEDQVGLAEQIIESADNLCDEINRIVDDEEQYDSEEAIDKIIDTVDSFKEYLGKYK